jgi:hypothetical protein
MARVFDFQTLVHHHSQSRCARLGGGCFVDNAELRP